MRDRRRTSSPAARAPVEPCGQVTGDFRTLHMISTPTCGRVATARRSRERTDLLPKDGPGDPLPNKDCTARAVFSSTVSVGSAPFERTPRIVFALRLGYRGAFGPRKGRARSRGGGLDPAIPHEQPSGRWGSNPRPLSLGSQSALVEARRQTTTIGSSHAGLSPLPMVEPTWFRSGFPDRLRQECVTGLRPRSFREQRSERSVPSIAPLVPVATIEYLDGAFGDRPDHYRTAIIRRLRSRQSALAHSEAFSLGSVSYPPVQPVAFSCCVRRAAIGATIERKRAGAALVSSRLTLTGDM